MSGANAVDVAVEGVVVDGASRAENRSGVLHEWVTRAARTRPDARAVIGEDRTLTYGEIERYSNRLASVLRARGCERGDRVGVLMPKSALAVASFIGVLKAACAYVPLDPHGANVRTAEMLRQCEPRLLLVAGCNPALVEDLASRNALGGTVVAWLDDGPAPAGTEITRDDVDTAPEDEAPAPVSPDDLAYILFTSGTTGKPKGVPIRHSSVHAFIEWAVSYFELGPEDRLSGHTALTFDLSTFDIYATFAAGAELHHVPKRALLIPHEIAALIEERRLTLWFSVPSQLAYVARFDALKGRDLSSLRHVAWCGDVLTPPTLMHWKERLPGVAFTNLYGPTEATVASSYYRVPDDYTEAEGSIPIGYACPGETLLVLDESMEPVSDGEIGDIYIGGVGLSPGYWRNPDRTLAAFLPLPAVRNGNGRDSGYANGNGTGSGAQHRIYKTGDRGRRRPDGAVVFLGRADFQIKTGGYRVEPAEVEHAISKLQEIAACAVVPVAVGDFSGKAIGCAYVPKNGAPIRTGELKKLLAADLPSYMVPTRWLVLSELPTDSRGKIDRPRLQALMGG
jgi:amino acid adenylation domain-containing protein